MSVCVHGGEARDSGVKVFWFFFQKRTASFLPLAFLASADAQLRPPASPLRLLPERRCDKTRQDRRPGARSRHASRRHNRHRQPVWRARVLAVLHSAAACSRSSAARSACARGDGVAPIRWCLLAQDAAGPGQPPAPVLGRLPDQRSGRAAARVRDVVAGSVGGADAADGRHARAAGQAAGRGPRAGGGWPCWRACRRRSETGLAVELHRHGLPVLERAVEPGLIIAGGPLRCAAGGHKRMLLRHARDA